MTAKLTEESEFCPYCGSDLRYGWHRAFSSTVCIYDRDQDKTVAVQCPHCERKELV